MTKEEHIKFWLKAAKHDLNVADTLFTSGKYDWCLFIAHLALEKALKALFVQKNNNKVPPKIHNLVKLAELSSTKLNEEEQIFFDEVNDFNLETRYPDYKNRFYHRCNKDFAKHYFAKIKESYKWLLSQIEFNK